MGCNTHNRTGRQLLIALVGFQLSVAYGQIAGPPLTAAPVFDALTKGYGYIPAMPLTYPYKLPSLPAVLQGLTVTSDATPVLNKTLSAQAMFIHFDQLLLHGVALLNSTLDAKPPLHVKTLPALMTVTLSDATVSESTRQNINKFGGALYNHILYFTTMRAYRPNNRPSPQTNPGIYGKIVERWNTFERFQDQFEAVANTVFGSGWVFLALPPNDFSLTIVVTPNEEVSFSVPEGNSGAYPILGIDLWEHAYFLDYQDRQGEYVKNWWSIVDWDRVEMNLKAANMSDLDTIIRLPETTYSGANFTGMFTSSTTPEDPALAAGAVKTLSATDVAATATKSKKSQVTPDAVSSAGFP